MGLFRQFLAVAGHVEGSFHLLHINRTGANDRTGHQNLNSVLLLKDLCYTLASISESISFAFPVNDTIVQNLLRKIEIGLNVKADWFLADQ